MTPMHHFSRIGEGKELEYFPPHPTTTTSTGTLDLALKIDIEVFGAYCGQTLGIPLWCRGFRREP